MPIYLQDFKYFNAENIILFGEWDKKKKNLIFRLSTFNCICDFISGYVYDVCGGEGGRTDGQFLIRSILCGVSAAKQY